MCKTDSTSDRAASLAEFLEYVKVRNMTIPEASQISEKALEATFVTPFYESEYRHQDHFRQHSVTSAPGRITGVTPPFNDFANYVWREVEDSLDQDPEDIGMQDLYITLYESYMAPFEDFVSQGGYCEEWNAKLARLCGKLLAKRSQRDLANDP